MPVVEEVAGVGLQAACVNAPVDIAGHAIEKQIADCIRTEMNATITAKGGDLQIQIADGFLICDHGVVILLVLPFIQLSGIKIRGWKKCEPRNSSWVLGGGQVS